MRHRVTIDLEHDEPGRVPGSFFFCFSPIASVFRVVYLSPCPVIFIPLAVSAGAAKRSRTGRERDVAGDNKL